MSLSQTVAAKEVLPVAGERVYAVYAGDNNSENADDTDDTDDDNDNGNNNGNNNDGDDDGPHGWRGVFSGGVANCSERVRE